MCAGVCLFAIDTTPPFQQVSAPPAASSRGQPRWRQKYENREPQPAAHPHSLPGCINTMKLANHKRTCVELRIQIVFLTLGYAVPLQRAAWNTTSHRCTLLGRTQHGQTARCRSVRFGGGVPWHRKQLSRSP